MKQVLSVLAAVVLAVVAVAGVYLYQQQKIDDLETKVDSLTNEVDADKTSENDNDSEQTDNSPLLSEKGVSIAVTSPASGSSVLSPLEVDGNVPGNWSHEAQFTVRLLDSSGKVLDEQPATLKGDWMTTDLVPFSVTLVFTKPSSGNGTLVLVKANPSGLEQNDDSLSIPVRF